MPRDRSMQLYLVRFSLADGEHVAAAHSIRWENEKQKQKIISNATSSLRPPTEEYPDGNPDFKFISIEPVEHPDVIRQAQADLYAKYPDRIGAEQLGLDTPNRILHEPEITRGIAAQKAVG